MSSDSHPIVRFEDGWEDDGIGPNGLPKFKPRLFVVFAKPPELVVRREAEDDDIEMYPEPYKLYQKLKAGRDLKEIDGYPIVLWPALNKSEVDQLLGHGIMTVEALAKMAGRTGGKTPAFILELASRAKRMLDMQKEGGKFEATIDELTRQRDALHAELTELRQQLAASNAALINLQNRLAGIALPLERAAGASSSP